MGYLVNPYVYASTAFSPTDIANIKLWLDASDTSTITSSSGKVSQWDDKSGNAHHVTQGVGALQPTTGSRTINGLNTIEYTGTEFLSRNDALSLTGNPNWTVFLVIRLDVLGSFDTYFMVGESTPTATRNVLYFSGGAAYAWRFNGGNEVYDVSVADSNDILLFERPAGGDIASSKFWRNGGTEQSATSSGNPTLSPSITDELTYVGGSFNTIGTFAGFDGILAEVIAYEKVLTSDEKNQVGNYLNEKWGAGWSDI